MQSAIKIIFVFGENTTTVYYLLCTVKRGVIIIKEPCKKPKRRSEDEKVISRAKACLMQYLNLTEEQAHRHIQKQAMDLRKKQREIAEDILRIYSK